MLEQAMQSPYILEEIKKTSWKNRDNINKILWLFRLMKKNRLSAAEGHVYFLLRNQYEEAYLNLLREMDPIKYQIYLEEQEKLLLQKEASHQNEIKRQQQIVEQEKKDYEMWLSIQKRA
ncbi:MAG: hypothetical protein NT127_06650 [Sphingobacteriales bacterium]|nr:hypothetical protein [Sphingobacteriales bacterium]